MSRTEYPLPTLITTSVVRGSQQGESHGGIYLVDFASQEVSPGIWRLQVRDVLPASARPQYFMRLSLTE